MISVEARQRLQARRCILAALDETVAQITSQAAQFEKKDAAAPILMTSRVTDWVERIYLALARYGEGEYAEAIRLADITGVYAANGDDEEEAYQSAPTSTIRRESA